ncbi:hypothetical protein Y032_0055g2581 [Ancylostoma ceylanicum]|nr:hypothetical protein Y032_0055g2581 [Ancylostoma ceylanicum]
MHYWELIENCSSSLKEFETVILFQVHRFVTSKNPLFICFASIPWFFSFLITFLMAIEGCFARTNPYTLTFTYECSTCLLYGPVLYYFGFIFPGINFVLYTLVYVQIIRVRLRFHVSINSRSDGIGGKRKEAQLVFQFSIICAIQFASSACFYVMPALLPGDDLAFHLPMIISTLNTVTNPVVMLLFQPRLRTAYATLIRECRISSNPSQMSVVLPTRLTRGTKKS